MGLLRTRLGRLVVLGSVENASFMPWLVGTALMHSLASLNNAPASKRGHYCWQSVPFVVSAGDFPGAFRRAGIGTRFASDPARGMFILAFMVLVIGVRCCCLPRVDTKFAHA